MFRGDIVGDADHFLITLRHDHLAEGLPRLSGMVGGRQDFQQAIDFRHRRAREFFAVGQQHAGAVGSVFDLAQNIGGREFRIAARLVGDDQRFGRTGEQIDADPAKKLPLGFGDEGIAGADQNVDRTDRLGSDRHRADRLDPAQGVDRVGTRHRLRRDDRPGRLATEGRRAADHPGHAGDLGGDDRHVGAGEQRIFAAGNIAAGRIDRDILVAEHHPRHCFDLDILHAVALDAGEIPDLGLREFDIAAFLRAQAVDAGVDFGIGQQEIVAVPLVERVRHRAHRGIAALLNHI